jgi:hypothetical protein
MPATHPTMKCFQSARSRPSLAASMLHPNRFIATLQPAMATSAGNSVMKLRYALATTITVDEKAYSTHRSGFIPRASHAS